MARSSNANIQEIYDALEKLSLRVTRVEQSIASPHDCFSRSYFSELTRSLSMPGLRFVGEKFQHRIHSYLWLLIHSVALLISYVYIQEEYNNWQSSPVVRTLSNNLTFVDEIPFPAITICVPYYFKSDYDYMKNIRKCMNCNSTDKNFSDCFYNGKCERDKIETLAVASGFCAFQGLEGFPDAASKVYSRDVNISIDGKLFSSLAQRVMPPCDFLVQQRINENKDFESGCNNNGFQHFLAYGAYGMCTTVNGLRHEDILKESVVSVIPIQPKSIDKRYVGKGMSLENMMYFNGGNNTIPAYFTEDDYFTFYITKQKNQTGENICNTFSNDEIASVILHNPAEIPLLQGLERMISVNKYNYMKVIPKLVITKKDLTRYSPTQRGCYYSHERELMLFKFYSESSCEAECNVNCSIKNCNCVPLYLPRPNTSLRVCVVECIYANCDCGCLPDCISLSYEFEARKESKNTNETGVLFVFYKNKSFNPMIRIGINDLAGFIAYSFGILGTFNGFSVMVIFEIIYFTTFRLWSSIKNYLNSTDN